MDVDMDSEVLESAAYGALRNSIRRLLKFIAVEVESQGGGVITIYNDQLEIVGSRRVYLPGLNELAFLGFIEIARLPKRNLISLSDRWRAVAATKRAKTLAGSGLL
jgi:hypothetical protein